MMLEQPAATPTEPTAPLADDPCTRIHLYQQQLRAELLRAAATSESHPARRHQALTPPARLWTSSASLGLTLSPVRAIESLLRGLTETVAYHTHHRTISLGAGPR
jgi:hypothetical protein